MLNLFRQIARALWLIFQTGNRWLGRAILLFLCGAVLIVSASLWSPTLAKAVVPIVTIFPFAVLLVIAPLPFVIIGLWTRSRKLLFMGIGAWFGIGEYFSLVPVAHNPRLIIPLVLAVAGWLAFRLAGLKGWGTRIFGLTVIIITVIFFLGERGRANAKIDAVRKTVMGESTIASSKTSANYHPSLMCLDDAGDRRELHHENLEKPSFREIVPNGCWMLVVLPNRWPADRWHWQEVGGDLGWKIYFMAPNGQPQGPFGWGSNGVNLVLPKSFYIQGTKEDEEVAFSIDEPMIAQSPAVLGVRLAPIVEPTALTIANAECTSEARTAKFSGTAAVSLTIDENGKVQNVEIDRSTGIPSLDAKMVEAAQKYKFMPATQNGKPVPFEVPSLEIFLAMPCQ